MPLVARAERGPPRPPGAAAARQHPVPRDRERRAHRLRQAHGLGRRADRRVDLDPVSAGRSLHRAVRPGPAALVRSAGRARQRQPVPLAAGRATTSGSRPGAGPRAAESSFDTPRSATHWFEANPLWFKTRGLLRDPPARLLRRQRRRVRRLPRADREARLPAVARRRLHLAAADVPVARCATAATTSPTSTPSTPTTGRSRTSARSSRPPTSAASASSPTSS